jgi:hypothetical protein
MALSAIPRAAWSFFKALMVAEPKEAEFGLS